MGQLEIQVAQQLARENVHRHDVAAQADVVAAERVRTALLSARRALTQRRGSPTPSQPAREAPPARAA